MGNTGKCGEHLGTDQNTESQDRVAKMTLETSPGAQNGRILDAVLKSLNPVLLLLSLSFSSRFGCYFCQEAFLDNPYYMKY